MATRERRAHDGDHVEIISHGTRGTPSRHGMHQRDGSIAPQHGPSEP